MVFNRNKEKAKKDEVKELVQDEIVEETFAKEILNVDETEEISKPTLEERLSNLEGIVLRMLNND